MPKPFIISFHGTHKIVWRSLTKFVKQTATFNERKSALLCEAKTFSGLPQIASVVSVSLYYAAQSKGTPVSSVDRSCLYWVKQFIQPVAEHYFHITTLPFLAFNFSQFLSLPWFTRCHRTVYRRRLVFTKVQTNKLDKWYNCRCFGYSRST